MTDITLNPKMIFILCVWLLFVMVFVRAFIRGKIVSKQAKRIWLIFFLCCLAFTFWGESSELALDRYFGYRPVALLVKYVCLIIEAHLFYDLLNDVRPHHALIPMKWIAPVAVVVGLVGFFVYDIYKPLSPDELRYLFIAARDSVVMVFVLLSFIPGTLAMRQDESIDMMRFKLNLIILMGLSFVVTALGSIVAAIWSLSHSGNPAVAASAVQPFVVLGIILFVLIMIPYRWILILFRVQTLLYLLSVTASGAADDKAAWHILNPAEQTHQLRKIPKN